MERNLNIRRKVYIENIDNQKSSFIGLEFSGKSISELKKWDRLIKKESHVGVSLLVLETNFSNAVKTSSIQFPDLTKGMDNGVVIGTTSWTTNISDVLKPASHS